MRPEDDEQLRAMFAASVRAERARAGLRQEDVAARMGWASRSIVAEVEAGHRRLSLTEVARLCEVLDVGLGDLVRGPLADEAMAALRVRPLGQQG